MDRRSVGWLAELASVAGIDVTWEPDVRPPPTNPYGLTACVEVRQGDHRGYIYQQFEVDPAENIIYSERTGNVLVHIDVPHVPVGSWIQVNLHIPEVCHTGRGWQAPEDYVCTTLSFPWSGPKKADHSRS